MKQIAYTHVRYICTLHKNRIVTASDFHKTLRNMMEQQRDNLLVFHLNDFLRRHSIDKQTLQEHLHTLETLELIQYQDEDEKSFFFDGIRQTGAYSLNVNFRHKKRPSF